jgi:hypothetical protein
MPVDQLGLLGPEPVTIVDRAAVEVCIAGHLLPPGVRADLRRMP